jgi:hypothetical protein
MPTVFCDLIELRLGPAGVEGTLVCPPTIRPLPGQYLLAFAPGQSEALATPLFPSGQAGEFLRVAPPLPGSWAVGMQLQVRGPFGNGFRLPASARKVALAAMGCNPERLLPLANQALAQDAAVVLYASTIPENLPADVEIMPLGQLGDVLEWADYLALDLAENQRGQWELAVGVTGGQKLPFFGQALLRSPIVCGGTGECGVCAVKTSTGWSLACKDGPVYDLENLGGGA